MSRPLRTINPDSSLGQRRRILEPRRRRGSRYPLLRKMSLLSRSLRGLTRACTACNGSNMLGSPQVPQVAIPVPMGISPRLGPLILILCWMRRRAAHPAKSDSKTALLVINGPFSLWYVEEGVVDTKRAYPAPQQLGTSRIVARCRGNSFCIWFFQYLVL